ncbi:hypothetical protein OHT20_18640 [Streptomyces caniferus]|uniref:hypothetical protein n=1 Tax=Streptomyces caniferus TaxID=285557 RepID=UPI002E2AF978|nr:hypothetical protein [Streptomyces caniferus]
MDTTDGWWDELYGEDDVDTTEAPAPRQAAVPADRLPFWWTGEGVNLGGEEDTTAPAEPVCEHPEPLEVRDSDGELAAYLCPACDAQIPVDTDEDEADPEQPYGGVVARTATAASKAGTWLPAGAKGIQLNPRAQRLLYNGSAAALGWVLHIGPPIKHVIEECGREASIGASLVLGIGICGAVAVLVDRRTRHWWPPLAWVCRAPLATAVLALLLYTPTAF